MSLMMAIGVAIAAGPPRDWNECLDLASHPRAQTPLSLADIRRIGDQPRDENAFTVWPAPTLLPKNVDPRRVWIASLRFTLDTNGRAVNCNAARSSGSAAVDARACELTQRHLRSRPMFADGRPIASQQRLAYRWQPSPPKVAAACEDDGGTLPIAPLEWAPSGLVAGRERLKGNVNTVVRLGITAAGRPSGCEIVATSAPQAIAAEICRIAVERAVTLPAVNDRGDTIPAVVVRLIRTRVTADYATVPLVRP